MSFPRLDMRHTPLLASENTLAPCHVGCRLLGNLEEGRKTFCKHHHGRGIF